MPPTRRTSDSVYVPLRMPRDMFEAIKAIGEGDPAGVSGVIREAIDYYLDYLDGLSREAKKGN